ncbi:prephenate dehydrogenase [Micromonosporaceae bacterium Da 78-11]
MDVAVIGLGLIGGSLMRALAAAGHRVTGFDADPATCALARADGRTVAGSVAEAVATAELVVLAVPLPVLPLVLDQLVGYDGLVTDVTSVKGPVRGLARNHGLRRYVGGHPMAGKETSGFAAADPRLFDGCAWVLCLEPDETALTDWLALAGLFTALGARVVPVTAAEHDRAVAQVSHVPHLFAAALAGQLRGNPLAGTLAAGSFRDGTRVAASRAELIAAMCGGNAAAVGAQLDTLLTELTEMRRLLDAADPVDALVPALRLPGELRRAWPATGGSATEAPATVDSLLRLGRDGGWVTGVGESRDLVTTMRPETDRYPA